jgi:hypothetical protein
VAPAHATRVSIPRVNQIARTGSLASGVRRRGWSTVGPMNRLAPIAVLFAGACGSATDDRPATLEYITETILAPSCAQAECHSAFKQQVGDVFDTVESTRRSMVVNGLVFPQDADDPAGSFLIKTLTVGTLSVLDPGSGTFVRMPFVSPMPDVDIQLIETWIRAGIPGAQCLPNAQNRGCQVVTVGAVPQYNVVECIDGNVGAVVQACSALQICDSRNGNGECRP